VRYVSEAHADLVAGPSERSEAGPYAGLVLPVDLERVAQVGAGAVLFDQGFELLLAGAGLGDHHAVVAHHSDLAVAFVRPEGGDVDGGEGGARAGHGSSLTRGGGWRTSGAAIAGTDGLPVLLAVGPDASIAGPVHSVVVVQVGGVQSGLAEELLRLAAAAAGPDQGDATGRGGPHLAAGLSGLQRADVHRRRRHVGARGLLAHGPQPPPGPGAAHLGRGGQSLSSDSDG